MLDQGCISLSLRPNHLRFAEKRGRLHTFSQDIYVNVAKCGGSNGILGQATI
jgi:hypothetical protein